MMSFKLNCHVCRKVYVFLGLIARTEGISVSKLVNRVLLGFVEQYIETMGVDFDA